MASASVCRLLLIKRKLVVKIILTNGKINITRDYRKRFHPKIYYRLRRDPVVVFVFLICMYV
jgi:hypothetical protein